MLQTSNENSPSESSNEEAYIGDSDGTAKKTNKQVKITSASEFTSRDEYFMQVILYLFSVKWHGIRP